MPDLRVATLAWHRPPPAGEGVASPFRAPLTDTYELLLDELTAIGSTHALLEVGVTDLWRLRQDGLPHVRTRMTHRGVDLLVTGKPGLLHYAATRYADWASNLRAIALGLKALRAVDRYGITPDYEQYRGWQQLPAAPPAPPGDQALRTLAFHAGVDHDPHLDDAGVARLFRAAVRRAHPDAGGTSEAADAVYAARRDLESAGRWPARTA